MNDPGQIPRFVDWLAEQVGTRKWCIAERLTDRLTHMGYTLAIPNARYHRLEEEYERLFGVEAAYVADSYKRRYGVELLDALRKRKVANA